MANRDLIVVGASAGGIEALQQVLQGTPPEIPAAIMIVLHMPPSGGRALRRILGRATEMPVVVAEEGTRITPGRVYVCVGGLHLLVGNGHIHLRAGPRENGHRPAIDPLFRSAAAYYGGRAIGVVLSGTLSDGTAGLYALRRQGGLAIVQDPADALYDGMPSNAIEYAGADFVVPASDVGALLGRLAGEEIDDDPRPERLLEKEVMIVEGNEDPVLEHVGKPSPWPCPDCNGVLWEIDEGPILRFRCRVGHAWDAETLLEQQGDGVEGALWMALRALEDRAALSRKLAERAAQEGRKLSASRYRDELESMSRNINILRRLLSGPGGDRQPLRNGADDEGNAIG